MNTLKVAVISALDSPLVASATAGVGGRQIAVAALIQQLATLGYELDVYTHWTNKHLPHTLWWRPNIRIVHIDTGLSDDPSQQEVIDHQQQFTKGIKRFINENNITYDVIHAHHWVSGLSALGLKYDLGLPLAITFHTLGKLRELHHDPGEELPSSRIAAESQLVQEGDHLIALCPQDQADLIEHYNARPERITIIPNGIDTATFGPMNQRLARSELGLETSGLLILQTCRLVPNKGIDNIIAALALLKTAHHLKARLVIVGGEPGSAHHPDHTPETNRLKQLAAAQGVGGAVIFRGQQPQELLSRYYNAADVFVTTPWYEPFGITPLEAMACGTPVIGSKVGGIKYSVAAGRSGFLVPPKDPAALAASLHKVLSNGLLRKRLGEGGKRRVQTRFTWEHAAKLTAGLYQAAVPQLTSQTTSPTIPAVFQTGMQ